MRPERPAITELQLKQIATAMFLQNSLGKVDLVIERLAVLALQLANAFLLACLSFDCGLIRRPLSLTGHGVVSVCKRLCLVWR